MQLKLPSLEIRSRTVELPKVDLPKVELPKVDLPKMERPKFDTPRIDLPKMELHRPDLPSVELHRPELPDLSGAGKAIGETIDTVGERIGSLGRDVRSLRITRKPEPNTAGTAGLALLGGLGTGMALMFFFDPEQGRRRRALLRDKLVRWTNVLTRMLRGRAADLQNRTAGLAHTVRSTTGGTQGSEWTEEPVSAAAAATADTPYVADQLESADAAAGRDASGQDWQPVAVGGRQPTGQAASDEWRNVQADATRETSDYPSAEIPEQERETSRSEI
jgi:hypothetical protein